MKIEDTVLFQQESYFELESRDHSAKCEETSNNNIENN